MNQQPRLAIVHDWLITQGGAEQVLKSLMENWPQAPIYTLLYDPEGACGEWTANRQIITSFLQSLPASRKRHRLFLPLMPLAIEQLDLEQYDILLSSSYAVAKGILTRPNQLHISYVHTPMRYAWDLQNLYLRQTGLDRKIVGFLARLILHYMRLWDQASANRVDVFLANSRHTAGRIWKTYRREAEVIYPPVDTEYFTPADQRGDYYLTISRLVPYKRIDLIVQAFSEMPDKKLVVIGDGPDCRKLRALAGKNVIFLGYQPKETLRQYMRNTKAFIFAALEDFGITPVEAQACGKPVIAYRGGGALETVVEGVSGIFFSEQSVESLRSAVLDFETHPRQFDPVAIRQNATRFRKDRFVNEIKEAVERAWEKFKIAEQNWGKRDE